MEKPLTPAAPLELTHDILPSRFRCVPIMQADLRFITSQQQSRIDALQQENDALRARFHDALVQNGIVLPSGHEVSNVLRTGSASSFPGL